MPHLLSSRTPLALAILGLAASPAFAGEVQPLGDTVLEPLGVDAFAATSTGDRPAVRLSGQTFRLRFEAADAGVAGAAALVLSSEVSRRGTSGGTFQLTFNGQTTSPSHFDGRFLSARDLTRDQAYRMEAGGSFGTAATFELYRGGVSVAVADVADGVAPFVLEGLGDTEGVYTVGSRTVGGREELEVQSWSLGTWTATFDSGKAIAIDRVVLAIHGGSIDGAHGLGATTVSAAGIVELDGGVEDLIVADGSPIAARVNDAGNGRASIDMTTASGGAVDVHSVFVPTGSVVFDTRTTVFTPPSGYRIRLRSRRDGAAFGAWSGWSSSATLVTPPPAAAEAIDDFEVGIQRAGQPTIASSGYIKVKKLNSGG